MITAKIIAVIFCSLSAKQERRTDVSGLNDALLTCGQTIIISFSLAVIIFPAVTLLEKLPKNKG